VGCHASKKNKEEKGRVFTEIRQREYAVSNRLLPASFSHVLLKPTHSKS
jgi:hypothetical protein